MRIIDTYDTQTAHYALIALDDAGVVQQEFKSRVPLDTAGWLALATAWAAAAASRAVRYLPLPGKLWTSKGHDLSITTVSASKAYLDSHSELYALSCGAFLLMPIGGIEAAIQSLAPAGATARIVTLPIGGTRYGVSDATVAQFRQALGYAVNAGAGSRMVCDCLQVEVTNDR